MTTERGRFEFVGDEPGGYLFTQYDVALIIWCWTRREERNTSRDEGKRSEKRGHRHEKEGTLAGVKGSEESEHRRSFEESSRAKVRHKQAGIGCKGNGSRARRNPRYKEKDHSPSRRRV